MECPCECAHLAPGQDDAPASWRHDVVCICVPCKQALQLYKAAHVDAFDNSVLRCVGPMDGGECPHTFEVNFNAPNAAEKMASLHLDHERPVHITCAWWAAQLPKHVNRWANGIDGGHALFGVKYDNMYRRRCVHFRCGPRDPPARAVDKGIL